MWFECPTVKVRSEGGGFVVINESDFNPEVHERWTEEPKAPPPRKGSTGGGRKASAPAQDGGGGGGKPEETSGDGGDGGPKVQLELEEVPGFEIQLLVSGKALEGLKADQRFASLSALAIHGATVEDLRSVNGIGPKVAQQLKAAAAQHVRPVEPPPG